MGTKLDDPSVTTSGISDTDIGGPLKRSGDGTKRNWTFTGLWTWIITKFNAMGSTNLGINTTNAVAQFQVVSTDLVNPHRGMFASQHTTATYGYVPAAIIGGLKSRGTSTSPTATASGDGVLTVVAKAYVGATNGYQSVGTIAFTTTADPTDTAYGPRADVIISSSNGSSGSVERIRLTGDGKTRFSNQAAAPANNAAGTVNDMIVDAAGGYVYFCTGLGGTANWKRIALNSY